MTTKAGRNNPCPCGSGRKYKHCCISVPAVKTEVADFGWHKLRQTEGHVLDNHLGPYLTVELPDDVISRVLEENLPEDLPEGLDQDLFFNNFLLPWVLYNWIPGEDFGIVQFNPDKTISQNYANIYKDKLNSSEKSFIEAMNKTYYSFYVVLEVEYEQALVVKDILLGSTHRLKERQGTHQIKRGDIIFSRILTLDNQSIFIGMMPFIVPIDHHNGLIDFKNWLIDENDHEPLSGELLRDEFDLALFDYLFDLVEVIFNPRMPILTNTDGDLLEFSKSYFKLTLTPEEALSELLPLALSKDPEEFLQDAKLNRSGAIKQIKMPWLKKGNKKHSDWNNTLMGEITLEKDKLILETNSEKRLKRGQKLLDKYLGDTISFQKKLIESVEQKLKAQANPRSQAKSNILPKAILESPEVREQVEVVAKAHWDSWFDKKIPALDDKTPREAAKTVKGREKLEALLLQYERHNADMTGVRNILKADLNYLKAELALD